MPNSLSISSERHPWSRSQSTLEVLELVINDRLDQLLCRLTRLGAGFSIPAATSEVDPERVLLETARLAPRMARLFIMAATWLHRYGDLIAKHRLKRLILEELEPVHRPTLGLLLDIAQQGTHPLQFASILRVLTPQTTGAPLFEVERHRR